MYINYSQLQTTSTVKQGDYSITGSSTHMPGWINFYAKKRILSIFLKKLINIYLSRVVLHSVQTTALALMLHVDTAALTADSD